MKCQICSKEASVFVQKMVNGKIQQFCYCLSCAKKIGALAPILQDISEKMNGEFLNLKDNVEIPSFTVPTTKSEIYCPHCKKNKATWDADHKMGCPYCYYTFGRPHDFLIDPRQLNHTYKGKLPNKKIPKELKTFALSALQKEKEYYVNKELFAHAAQTRDEIDSLKKY